MEGRERGGVGRWRFVSKCRSPSKAETFSFPSTSRIHVCLTPLPARERDPDEAAAYVRGTRAITSYGLIILAHALTSASSSAVFDLLERMHALTISPSYPVLNPNQERKRANTEWS